VDDGDGDGPVVLLGFSLGGGERLLGRVEADGDAIGRGGGGRRLAHDGGGGGAGRCPMTASGDRAKAAATAATMSLFITLSPGCTTSSGGAGTMTFATARRRPETGHFPVKGFESVLEV